MSDPSMPPLPKASSVLIAGLAYTADQMRAYGEACAAAERERWRGLAQEVLDADEGDYVLGTGLADKLRAALRA